MISRGASAGARIPHEKPRVCGVYAYEDAVLVLDPGNAVSYPGSGQVVRNVIRAPSDGSAQTAYDFYFGLDETVENTAGRVSDPTFVGLPGGCDGYLASPNPANTPWILRMVGNNPAFLQNMHQNGSKFTIEMWIDLHGDRPGGFSPTPMFNSGCSDHSGNMPARGVYYGETGENYLTDSEHCIVLPWNAETGAGHRLFKVADAQVAHNQVNMLAVSLDTTGAEPSFLYKNGAYDPVDASDTWDGTPLYASGFPTENKATVNGTWMAERPDVYWKGSTRSRMYFLRVYDRNLAKAELDANWSALRGRWGI